MNSPAQIVAAIFSARNVSNALYLFFQKTALNYPKALKNALLIAAALILIPLVATFASPDFNWKILDFVVGYVLLFALCFSLYLANQRLQRSKFKPLIVIAIVLIFLLIWAELAVGIFGTPWAGK